MCRTSVILPLYFRYTLKVICGAGAVVCELWLNRVGKIGVECAVMFSLEFHMLELCVSLLECELES